MGIPRQLRVREAGDADPGPEFETGTFSQLDPQTLLVIEGEMGRLTMIRI